MRTGCVKLFLSWTFSDGTHDSWVGITGYQYHGNIYCSNGVTTICEYIFFFRFRDCDGFADINFCDMISEVKCNFATSPKRTTSTRDAVDWALYCLNWSFCIGTCSQHKICPMVPSGLDIDTNSFAYMMRLYKLHTWPSLNSRVNSFSFISKKKKSSTIFNVHHFIVRSVMITCTTAIFHHCHWTLSKNVVAVNEWPIRLTRIKPES